MEQLQIAIIDDNLTGIAAIRYRDSDGQNPVLGLSQRSRSQANKRAKAILSGKISPVGFLIRNHRRRIADLNHEGNSPLANRPIRPDSPATIADYIDSIIAVQSHEIEWLNKQKYAIADKRRKKTGRCH